MLLDAGAFSAGAERCIGSTCVAAKNLRSGHLGGAHVSVRAPLSLRWSGVGCSRGEVEVRALIEPNGDPCAFPMFYALDSLCNAPLELPNSTERAEEMLRGQLVHPPAPGSPSSQGWTRSVYGTTLKST